MHLNAIYSHGVCQGHYLEFTLPTGNSDQYTITKHVSTEIHYCEVILCEGDKSCP